MDGMLFWNIIISLVFAPIFYTLKTHASELQRQNILINRTREEVAREYLTRSEHTVEFQRLIDKIDKLDAKIDKLITT